MRSLIGARVVSHGRSVTFEIAGVAAPRQIVAKIPSLIACLQSTAAPA
jgi:hypothetical protein